MERHTSFFRNVLNGIRLRLNRIFSKEQKFQVGTFQEKFLKHLPYDKIHSQRLLGKTTFFRGGPEYLHALQEIFVENLYNQPLPERAYIIDCGAHIGISVIFLKHICSTAEIVCFEPDEKNFELLLRNIKSHGLSDVKAENKAIWINDAPINFNMEGNMSSRIDTGNEGGKKVDACRLYDLLDRNVDFLKIDIEGAEYQVMKDIEPRLTNVQKLFLEYHGSFQQNQELVEIISMLVKNNFHFYIKEAAPVYDQPFTNQKNFGIYDLQLNIFCIKNSFTFQNN